MMRGGAWLKLLDAFGTAAPPIPVHVECARPSRQLPAIGPPLPRHWCGTGSIPASGTCCRTGDRVPMNDATSQAPQVDAPGQPGISPTWTSSAKDAVGCSLGAPRLWFTIGHGIINEIY